MTPRKRTLFFTVYSLCLLNVNWPVARALTDLSRSSPTASHLVLVPVVSLVLIYLQRDSIFSSVRSGGAAAAAVILIGVGLAWRGSLYDAAGRTNDLLSVAVLALVVLWIGGFLLFYGSAAFRAALFPLLFLGFMIPIPSALLDGATHVLKTGSAETVSALMTLLGVTYHREGFVFSLPQVVIEIADECSGIRSSIALLLTSLLAGHVCLRSGWKKAALAAVTVQMAVVKNGIRIVTLSLLAVHWDPSFLAGRLHHEGGFVFYLVGLALLGPILAVLQRSESPARSLASVSALHVERLANRQEGEGSAS